MTPSMTSRRDSPSASSTSTSAQVHSGIRPRLLASGGASSRPVSEESYIAFAHLSPAGELCPSPLCETQVLFNLRRSPARKRSPSRPVVSRRSCAELRQANLVETTHYHHLGRP